MPQIDFCFRGWVRGANVEICTDNEDNDVDVSDMDAETLAQKLSRGELNICLGEHLYDNRKYEIEIHDFEEST